MAAALPWLALSVRITSPEKISIVWIHLEKRKCYVIITEQHELSIRLMTDTPNCPYSRREIVYAGKVLASRIPDSEARSSEVLEAFKIARSWREANAYPMRRIRAELTGKSRSAKVDGITAARLKRMPSIRKKLRSSPRTLYQIQDIGECRIIANDIDNYELALRPYMDGNSRYNIVDEDDYVKNPKRTGYRSKHLILKFCDPEVPGFDRHFVEVQFRTKKQHSWATAVEAVGLVRREDLKGGTGNADWLRLFALMAAEMAEDEGTGPVPNVSTERSERQRELAELNRKLNALQKLDSYNRAIKHTENIYSFSAPYYLIKYDIENMSVEVKPFNKSALGTLSYDRSESDQRFNSVLVEVDKIADLREAYPNYFLDVGDFTKRLRRAVHKEMAQGRFDALWLQDWIEGSRR